MNRADAHYPRRIVCLTEETTETLYLLGEAQRIVGISGFTVRPPQARKEKPKVAAFTSAKVDKILALEPDLVLGFSDLQADIAAQLIRAGVAVHVFNQRTIAGILDMVLLLGAMVGVPDKAQALCTRWRDDLNAMVRNSTRFGRRPKIYFEEWDSPLISGIGWVSELIQIAGGDDCFGELSVHSAATQRIIADTDEVVRRSPDIVVGSWCGKKFQPDRLRQRPGWHAVPAVRDAHLYEIKSSDILQPGPAALTDGARHLHAIVQRWAEGHQ